MALAIIRGQTAVANVSITPVGKTLMDWTNVFQSIRVRSTLPQIDATVYGNEANGAFIAGIERLTFDMTGLLTKDDAGSPTLANVGPHLPLSSWQGAVLAMQYDTGCVVSATVNWTDGEINRPAGAMGVISGQAVSTGVFTVTWKRVAPP